MEKEETRKVEGNGGGGSPEESGKGREETRRVKREEGRGER